MANRKKGDTGRAYIRLTRHDRNQIEEMLKKRASCRQIAKAIGRAPSTVSNEVERHRYVVAPKALEGAKAPDGLEAACETLAAWPRCCNGCRRASGYGCSRKPSVSANLKLTTGTAVVILNQNGTGRKPHVQHRTAKDRDRDLHQIRSWPCRHCCGAGVPDEAFARGPAQGLSGAWGGQAPEAAAGAQARL